MTIWRLSFRVTACLAAFALAFGLAANTDRGFADDKKSDDKADSKKADSKDADSKKADKDEEKDQFKVPDGKPAELLEFVEKMGKFRPTTVQELLKSRNAAVEAADKILENEDADEKTVLAAAEAKFGALSSMTRFSPDASKKIKEFAEKLKDDDRPKLAALAKEQLKAIAARERAQALALQVAKIRRAKEDKLSSLTDEIMAEIKKDEFDRGAAQAGMQLARALETREKGDLAARVYNTLGELMTKSDDEVLKEYAPKMEGAARKVNLKGNPIEIKGKTLDGQDFNIDTYKGKVVLVDFWATWCGPCIGELPNVKKNYEKYHDLGFEIVAISLDSNRKKLESFVEKNELEWVQLFSDDADATGWEHPLATYYGITSIPAVLLVDQEGKVVNMQARGPVLGKELERLLGPIEEKDSKDTKDKEVKDSKKPEAKAAKDKDE